VKDPTRLALALLGVSLVTLTVLSGRIPLGPLSSDYAALVNQAEDSIHGFAQNGPHILVQPEGRAALEELTKRPLAPLLSAWSALSVGRVGLLDGSSSVRLPWLILAGAMPVSVFLFLRQRASTVTAFGAGFWLFLSPGFVSSALAVRPNALAVWSGWLVLVASVCTGQARTPRARCALSLLCAALACLAFGLSFRALWIVPLLLIHAWSARPRGTLLAARHTRAQSAFRSPWWGSGPRCAARSALPRAKNSAPNCCGQSWLAGWLSGLRRSRRTGSRATRDSPKRGSCC
jgi:hypothetical protein